MIRMKKLFALIVAVCMIFPSMGTVAQASTKTVTNYDDFFFAVQSAKEGDTIVISDVICIEWGVFINDTGNKHITLQKSGNGKIIFKNDTGFYYNTVWKNITFDCQGVKPEEFFDTSVENVEVVLVDCNFINIPQTEPPKEPEPVPPIEGGDQGQPDPPVVKPDGGGEIPQQPSEEGKPKPPTEEGKPQQPLEPDVEVPDSKPVEKPKPEQEDNTKPKPDEDKTQSQTIIQEGDTIIQEGDTIHHVTNNDNTDHSVTNYITHQLEGSQKTPSVMTVPSGSNVTIYLNGEKLDVSDEQDGMKITINSEQPKKVVEGSSEVKTKEGDQEASDEESHFDWSLICDIMQTILLVAILIVLVQKRRKN